MARSTWEGGGGRLDKHSFVETTGRVMMMEFDEFAAFYLSKFLPGRF